MHSIRNKRQEVGLPRQANTLLAMTWEAGSFFDAFAKQCGNPQSSIGSKVGRCAALLPACWHIARAYIEKPLGFTGGLILSKGGLCEIG